MKFNPGQFNRLLSPTAGGLGQRLTWRPATPCPCFNPSSGAPKQGCRFCEGRGFSYPHAFPAWTGLAGVKATREWAASGLWESGDLVVSIPSDSPLWAAAERDRVTLSDSSQPFHQQLQRGVQDRLGPAYRAATIQRVVWIEEDILREASPRDVPSVVLRQDGIPYVGQEGFAYLAPAGDLFPSVRDDGTLVWRDGEGPAPGAGYTVMGRCGPEYFFFKDLIQDRAYHGGMALPRRCVLRKFDMMGR